MGGGLSAPTGSVARLPLRIAIRLTSSPSECYSATGVRDGLKERARSQIEMSIDCAAWNPLLTSVLSNAVLLSLSSRRQICRHKTILAVVWLLCHDNGSLKRNGLPIDIDQLKKFKGDARKAMDENEGTFL